MSELEIWNELGNIYYNSGAFDQAIRAYHKAIELDHGCGQSFSNLAAIYIHKEFYTEAILMYQKGIELLDNAADKALLWNRLGDAYLRVDDYDSAIAAYQTAVELDPENAALKNDLAKVKLGSAHSLSAGNPASGNTLPEPEFIQTASPSPESTLVESTQPESQETLAAGSGPEETKAGTEIETEPEAILETEIEPGLIQAGPLIVSAPLVAESICLQPAEAVSEESLPDEPAVAETELEPASLLESASSLGDAAANEPASPQPAEILAKDMLPDNVDAGAPTPVESKVEAETVLKVASLLSDPPVADPTCLQPEEILAEEALTTEPALVENELETETVLEKTPSLSNLPKATEPESACWVFKAHEPSASVDADENGATEKPPLILGSRVLSEEPDEELPSGSMDQPAESSGLDKNESTDAPGRNIPMVPAGPDSAQNDNPDTLDHIDKKLPPIEPKMGEPINSRAKALLKLGLVHWRRGDYEGALQFLKTALNLASVFSDTQFEALCFNAVALVETDLGKFDAAILAFENAASLDPEHIFPWNDLGNLYSKSDRYEEALAAYKKAIEHNPKDPLSWNGLGDVYHKLGRNEDAISAYQLGNVFDSPARPQAAATVVQMASNKDGENPLIWHEIGNIDYINGAYDEAINAYSNAIELLDNAIDKALLWKRMGDAYEQLNENMNAKAAYKKAVELDPENVALQDNIARIESAPVIVGPESCPEPSKPAVETDQEASRSSEPCDTGTVLPESEEAGKIESDTAPIETADEAVAVPQEQPAVSETAKDPEPEAPYWVFKPNAPVRHNPRPVGEAPHPSGGGFRLAAETGVGNGKPSPAFVLPKYSSQALLEKPLLTDTYNDPTMVMVEEAPAKEISTGVERIGRFIAPDDQDSVFSKAEPETVGTSQRGSANADIPSLQASMPADRVSDQYETNIHILENDIAAYRKVTEINPLNDRAWDALGNMYEAIGLHSEAITAFDKAISLASQREVYHYHLGLAHAAQKHYDKAIQALQKVVALNPDYMLAHCALAGYYRRVGKETEAKEHTTIARPYMETENDYNQACFESICGNTDRAFAFLRTALDKKQIQLDLVRSDPDLDFIRTDPRFEELIIKNSNISQ